MNTIVLFVTKIGKTNPFGKVTFALTLAIALSVTFALQRTASEVFPRNGVHPVTVMFGLLLSRVTLIVKLVLTVAFRLPEESLARNCTRYVPLSVVSLNVILKMLSVPLTRVILRVDPLGRVIFAMTDAILPKSVTFAAIRMLSFAVKFDPAAGSTLITRGALVSLMTNVSLLLLKLPELSRACQVTLYCPTSVVFA